MSLRGPPLGAVVRVFGFGRPWVLKWRGIADDRSGCALYWGFDGLYWGFDGLHRVRKATRGPRVRSWGNRFPC